MAIDEASNDARPDSRDDSRRALVEPPFEECPLQRYNAFMAYSNKADSWRAAGLQAGLHGLAKPFWKDQPALRVFRDETSLSASAGLWPSIRDAIDGSDWFLLLASCESARSEWVGREIERWLATKSANRLLIVCTDGEWLWDTSTEDFDLNRSSAIHPALKRAFVHQPRIADMSWVTDERDLSLRNARFLNLVADIAAPIHGVPKDALEGREIRRQRRVRWARMTLTGVFAVIVGVVVALRQRHPTEHIVSR